MGNSLAEIAAKEVKSNGVFTVPGLCRIKTRVKPATKAGKREMFGKMVIVKAQPAKTGEGIRSCRPEAKHLISPWVENLIPARVEFVAEELGERGTSTAEPFSTFRSFWRSGEPLYIP